MKKFKVYSERTEVHYAIIEADSIEEAEEYADENYTDCEWNYVDGTLSVEVLIGESEEVQNE